MLMCFDVKPEAKKALDSIMVTGQFADPSEAISTALATYDALCRAHATGGQKAVDELLCLGAHAAPAPKHSAETVRVRERQQEPTCPTPVLPDLFALRSPIQEGQSLPAPLTPPPAEPVVPPPRWLFGQYNKFLPVKASCRALLNLQHDSPKGIPLSKASDRIAAEACKLGDFLSRLDRRQLRGREQALAAAFPVSAANGAQSQIRFANQFVGSLRQGKLIGFPAALLLVACDTSKDSRLSLTRAGIEFATLENPVFDTDREHATQRLSAAEIQFLLDHIKHFAPQELCAYTSILDGIAEGSNSPDTIDAYLARRFQLTVAVEAKTPNEITQTFLTTQRTGAISRMADLGLIAREKTGIKVAYLITQSGQDFRARK